MSSTATSVMLNSVTNLSLSTAATIWSRSCTSQACRRKKITTSNQAWSKTLPCWKLWSAVFAPTFWGGLRSASHARKASV